MRLILICFNIIGAGLLFILTESLPLKIAGLSANALNILLLFAFRSDDTNKLRATGRIISLIGIIGTPLFLLNNAIVCGIERSQQTCDTLIGSFFYASIAVGLLSVPFWYAAAAFGETAASYRNRKGMPWYHRFMSVNEKLRKQALAFLKTNPIMTVSTASLKGEPQVSTVYYSIDDDFTIYFLAGKASRKITNLTSNKKIAFTMWGGADLVTIQGGGEVEIHEGGQEDMIARISKKLDKIKPYHWPLLEANTDGSVVVKIKPTWIVWLSADPDHPENHQKSYHYIVS